MAADEKKSGHQISHQTGRCLRLTDEGKRQREQAVGHGPKSTREMILLMFKSGETATSVTIRKTITNVIEISECFADVRLAETGSATEYNQNNVYTNVLRDAHAAADEILSEFIVCGWVVQEENGSLR